MKGVQDSLLLLVWCLTDCEITQSYLGNMSSCHRAPPLSFQSFQLGLDGIRERCESFEMERELSVVQVQSGVMFVEAAKPDIIIVVDGRKFPCHKCFLVRSEYFQALLMGGFVEGRNEGKRDSIHVQSVSFTQSPDVFACILEFLYTDRCLRFADDSIYMLEILRAADLLLLVRLKSACVNYLVSLPFSRISNPAMLLRASWDMNLPRLEQYITKLYAQDFDRFVVEQEFHELVRDSAESVVNREQVDTVIFVDDLKWWLCRLYGFDGEDDVGVIGKNGEVVVKVGQNVYERRETLQTKIEQLDTLLASLGF
ncbi:BTB/POZ protein [Obelidium mucronatum]|nr:BTB/POZ protein [Obelidium mucronatum]